MKKITTIIVVALVIAVGFYAYVTYGLGDTKFEWGDESLTGTGTLYIEVVTIDGRIIDITPGNDPFVIFHDSVVITAINAYILVTALDLTGGQIPRYKVDMSGGTGMQLEWKYGTVDPPSTIRQRIDPVTNIWDPPKARDATGEIMDSTVAHTLTYDLATIQEGDLTLTLTLSGQFTYCGCDATGTEVTGWFTETLDSPVIRTVYLVASGDLYTFNWHSTPGDVT